MILAKYIFYSFLQYKRSINGLNLSTMNTLCFLLFCWGILKLEKCWSQLAVASQFNKITNKPQIVCVANRCYSGVKYLKNIIQSSLLSIILIRTKADKEKAKKRSLSVIHYNHWSNKCMNYENPACCRPTIAKTQVVANFVAPRNYSNYSHNTHKEF